MNIWFANAFETLPGRAQRVPQAIGRLDKRTRLIAVSWRPSPFWGCCCICCWRNRQPERMHVRAARHRRDGRVAERHRRRTHDRNRRRQFDRTGDGARLRSADERRLQGRTDRPCRRSSVPDRSQPFQAALEQARAQLAKDYGPARQRPERPEALRHALRAERDFLAAARPGGRDRQRPWSRRSQSDRAAVDVAASQSRLHPDPLADRRQDRAHPIQPGNLVTVNGHPLVAVTADPAGEGFVLPAAERSAAHPGSAPRPARSVALLDHAWRHGGQDLTAPVDFVSNAVNAPTGTIELRATFDNARSPAGAGPAGRCGRRR